MKGLSQQNAGTRHSIFSERADLLMQKALDREFLAESEVREFGAAMIGDPEFAEAYVLMRRIAGDTARLPRKAPSPGFADRVMASVRLAPAPLAPASLSRRQWSFFGVMAAAVMGIVAVAGLALTGNPWEASEWTTQIQVWFSSAWNDLVSTMPSGAFLVSGTPLAEYAVWIMIFLAAAAGALNIWSARQNGSLTQH